MILFSREKREPQSDAGTSPAGVCAHGFLLVLFSDDFQVQPLTPADTEKSAVEDAQPPLSPSFIV